MTARVRAATLALLFGLACRGEAQPALRPSRRAAEAALAEAAARRGDRAEASRRAGELVAEYERDGARWSAEDRTAAGRAYAVLAMTVTFLAFQQGAISPVTWLMLSEIFPLKMRGFGLGIAAFALWITNFLVGLTFPVLVDAVGVSNTFFVFVALGIMAVTFVNRYVPETRGRTLENLETELKARFS